MAQTRPPLSALLSQVLVAYTIEFDNEAEHRMPHRTTAGGKIEGAPAGPWLVSLVMYENCMRYVPDQGITVGEIERLARTATNIGGMHRWRYISIDPKPANSGAKNVKPSSFVKPTAGGKRAREIWRPLFAEIEERWRTRFGAAAIDNLRQSLQSNVSRLDPKLPDCMPILHYGLAANHPADASPEIGEPPGVDVSGLSLYSLLAKSLIAFMLLYEKRSRVSLAISANILRVMDAAGVPLRDIPARAGVSKESVAMAEGWLLKMGMIELQNDEPPIYQPFACDSGRRVPEGRDEGSSARKRIVRLTPKGVTARDEYSQWTDTIEQRWRERMGNSAIDRLRSTLETFVGLPGPGSTLMQCLAPYPENWRAKLPKPSALPHFPMVLHRGGYPDGS